MYFWVWREQEMVVDLAVRELSEENAQQRVVRLKMNVYRSYWA